MLITTLLPWLPLTSHSFNINIPTKPSVLTSVSEPEVYDCRDRRCSLCNSLERGNLETMGSPHPAPHSPHFGIATTPKFKLWGPNPDPDPEQYSLLFTRRHVATNEYKMAGADTRICNFEPNTNFHRSTSSPCRILPQRRWARMPKKMSSMPKTTPQLMTTSTWEKISPTT